MKKLLVNWDSTKENFNETTFLFEDLKEIFGENADLITLNRATKSLGNPVAFSQTYRYHIIDKIFTFEEYLREYENLFEPSMIISDDLCLSLANLKTPIISIAENPYLDMVGEIFKKGKYAKDHYFEYGKFCGILQEIQYGKSKKIIAVGKLMQDYVKKLGFESEIICPGVNTDFFCNLGDYKKPELKLKYGLPLDKKIGITVTTFNPTKNWEMMVKIIKKFKDIFWIVCFTQKADFKPRLPNVKIFESLDREQLRELYNCANFFISTSTIEGFNIFPVQAMACQLPIISFETGFVLDTKPYMVNCSSEEYYPTDFGIIIKENKFEIFKKAIEEMKKTIDGELYEFYPRDAVSFYELTSDDFLAKWTNL